MKTIGVILAAGTSQRFGGALPKQFLMLENKEVLAYSLETFFNNENVDELVLIINQNYKDNYLKIIERFDSQKPILLVAGGETRQESVQKAIGFIASRNEEAIVLVHDAARPYVSDEIINENIESVKKFTCCTTAIPSSDSVYTVKNGMFESELVRANIYLAQTPQSSYLSIFKKAFDTINEIYTDEAALFSKMGYVPHIVLGEPKNIKITYPEDLKK